MSALEARLETVAWSALQRVYDPCSQAWGRPLSIVDLGLVRAVEPRPDGSVRVLVSLTVPFCMAVATIMRAVECRVGEVPGVESVDVEIDQDTPWSPDLMTESGRRFLAERRGETGSLRLVSGAGDLSEVAAHGRVHTSDNSAVDLL
jgi:metal-sulfur cluster biosynthetic enzyme